MHSSSARPKAPNRGRHSTVSKAMSIKFWTRVLAATMGRQLAIARISRESLRKRNARLLYPETGVCGKRADRRGLVPWPSPICRALALMLSLVVFGLVVSARVDAQETLDQVVASVDGEPITVEDVREYARIRGVTLPAAIDEKLFDEEVKSIKGEVDDAMVDRYIQSINAQNHVSDQEFREALRQRNISYEDFRKRAREQVERMVLIQREVREKVKIPDAEIEAYYKSHPEEFTVKEERYQIAQILIAVEPDASQKEISQARAKAQAIRARILEGENFAALAQRYSDDPSKSNGGELGWFKPDELLDEIREVVSKLNVGDISPVVQTSHGFHILKVEDHEKPGLQPLSKVRDQIEAKLMQTRLEKEFRRWVREDLAKRHVVEYAP